MPIEVESKAAAEGELAHWKSLLPQAQDVYRPSGKVPLVAYPLMLIGALIGVPIGAAGATVILAVGGLLVFLLAQVVLFLMKLPIFFYVIALALIGLTMVVAFLGWLATYAVLGLLAGGAVSISGDKGKSRGRMVQSVLGLMSALASRVIFWIREESRDTSERRLLNHIGSG